MVGNDKLPEGWAETTLDDVVILRNEKIEPSTIESVPYISLAHIESDTNRITNHGLSADVKSLKSVFRSGDVLYGKLRPYLNKVYQPDFSGVCSTDILVFKQSQAIDNRFLLHLAHGVKTNVLFFTRGKTDKGNTKNVWVYDMRTNMPSFGKRTPLTLDHFKDFIAAYGKSPYGKSKRKDQGESGRFRCFTREQISKRNDSLDISWLQDDSVRNGEDLSEPNDIAEEILAQLDLATKEMQELARLLGEVV